jgi:hypothetical protein
MSNVVDIIPDEFYADVLRSLKFSFEEALSVSALTAPDADTTVLGKHPLTPLEATANVDDAAAKNLQSFNSAFTPFNATTAVDQGPHLMSTPERPSKKARTTSRLDKIAMFLQQNEMQVVKGLRLSFTTSSAAAQASYY